MKEKIMMIGPVPPPPGGVATVTYALLNSSLRDKYTYSILDIARKKKRYRIANDRHGLRSLFYLVLNIVKLGRLLYKEKPAIVHIQSCTGALLRDFFFVILAKLWKKPVVFHLHGFYSGSHLAFKYTVLRKFSQFMMKRVDVLILLAKTFVPDFDILFPKTPKAVVPNSILQDDPKKAVSVRRPSRPEVDILFIGRLSRLKGIYELLDAAYLLKDERVRLLLAGLSDTKEDEVRIARQIEEKGLRDKVTLLGYIEGQKKADLLENSDIFVLPSHTEMFPVTIIEAMAAATPVIATSVGAIQDIVRDGVCGFVIPPKDHELLAEKIRYLVNNPAERTEMGQNGIQRFRQEYRIDICVERIDRIYKSLLDRI